MVDLYGLICLYFSNLLLKIKKVLKLMLTYIDLNDKINKSLRTAHNYFK